MDSVKDFLDQSNNVLAHAAIPDTYMIGASMVDGFQHETVPLFITAHAIDTNRNIMFFGLSDEKFTTYKNKMIKMALNYMQDVRWNSIRDFIEPEDYLQEFAEALSQMKLNPVGEAALPSIYGQNQQQAYSDFMAEYNAAFQRDAQLGTTTKANNSIFRSFMRRYEGTSKSGQKCSVVAGMDYFGIEYYSPGSMLAAINPLAGLLGAVIQNKQAQKSSDRIGHGTPCDGID